MNEAACAIDITITEVIAQHKNIARKPVQLLERFWRILDVIRLILTHKLAQQKEKNWIAGDVATSARGC